MVKEYIFYEFDNVPLVAKVMGKEIFLKGEYYLRDNFGNDISAWINWLSRMNSVDLGCLKNPSGFVVICVWNTGWGAYTYYQEST